MAQSIDDSPIDPQWWDLFHDEHRPPRRRLRLPLPAVVGIAGSVGIAATVAVWSALPGTPEPSPAGPSTVASAPRSTAPASDPANEELLRQRLPSGYRGEPCSPGPPATGGATLTCGAGAGSGAPRSATFTLVSDRSALQAALDDVVAGLAVQDCPGRIQSPGPWRTFGAPEPRGVLVCGVSDRVPVIAWTDQTALTMNVVRSDPGGPAIEDMFGWWGNQS